MQDLGHVELEYEAVTRCFKCQGLGHIGKVCRNVVTCGKCGDEGHHAVACPESDSGIRCDLCVRSGV